jgi:hypothetical protein
MGKESNLDQSGRAINGPASGEEKKKRLAAALRRNLAKRKDTKEAKIVDKPVKE